MKKITIEVQQLSRQILMSLCVLSTQLILTGNALGATSAVVTVKVTVVAPPPCIINDNKPIEVDFGDIMTTRVNGENYKMPVDYSWSCSGMISNEIKLRFDGVGASFDKSVLRTNTTGLGISLLVDGNKLPLNSWRTFTYPRKPEVFAIPVKQSGVSLKGGAFTASATMSIDYQ